MVSNADGAGEATAAGEAKSKPLPPGARAVDGSPTKAFFVRMITRDITLEDCILDLIDNSIDGAWQLAGGMPVDLETRVDLSAYEISIMASEEAFTIVDNCGGIGTEEAKERAFTFGRNTDEFDDYSIGVYGIGMKRAVFKMGRAIEVVSTHLAGEKLEAFRVPIDVKEWLGRKDAKDWNFGLFPAPPLPKPGVKITVNSLYTQTSASLGNPKFIQNLRRMIARDYSLHLRHGIVVKLNGQNIRGWPIEVRASGDIAPARINYMDENEEGKVRVELVAGMLQPPPDDIDPEDVGDDDRFGWYVACNGRIVMAAEKGLAAGWGTDDWPSWHGQYNGFLGIVLFSSERAAALPLTTTKRSVDQSSAIYLRARPRMRQASKDWIAYTALRRQAKEDAEKIERASAPVPLASAVARERMVLPLLRQTPQMSPQANVSYKVPLERFNRLAAALGDINMKRGDLGVKTFEYTFKYEAED